MATRTPSNRVNRGRIARTFPGERQPDAELEYDETGKIRGSIDYIIDSEILTSRIGTTRSFIFERYSRHPDEPLALLYNIRRKFAKNARTLVTYNYFGIWRDPTDWVIKFQSSLSEDPIETHPEFVLKIGGLPQAPLNLAIYDDDNQFVGFPVGAPNALAGVTGYLVPSFVVSLSRFTSVKPTSQTGLGKIRQPPISVSTPAEVKNFLLSAVTFDQTGNLYEETRTYLGSGPRGWNRIIYG